VVVVVVGADVVGVVVDDFPFPEEGAVVVDVEVVGSVLVAEVAGGLVPVDGLAELTPGCSLATTTPITAVAPVAASTAVRVSRRMRVETRSRASGELCSLGCVIDGHRFFSSAGFHSTGPSSP
jgi:hypothetical protein